MYLSIHETSQRKQSWQDSTYGAYVCRCAAEILPMFVFSCCLDVVFIMNWIVRLDVSSCCHLWGKHFLWVAAKQNKKVLLLPSHLSVGPSVCPYAKKKCKCARAWDAVQKERILQSWHSLMYQPFLDSSVNLFTLKYVCELVWWGDHNIQIRTRCLNSASWNEVNFV